MSQAVKTGRRTPLTLGQPNKNRDEKTDPLKSVTTAPNDKQPEETNVDQLKAKVQTDLKAKQTTKQTENGAKNGTPPTKNGPSTDDKIKQNVQIKLDKVKDLQIPGNENKEDSKTKITPTKSVDKTEKTKQENGSSKVESNKDTKVESKPKENVPKKESQDKDDKKEKTPTDIPIVAPITPELTPSKDSPKSKKDISSGGETSPKPLTATKQNTPVLKPVTDSILEEKDLKGFDEVGAEMDSLPIDPETGIDSPMPKERLGKIVKLKQGPPTRARTSPFRKNDKLQNASTIVNLSTVSEQSTELSASISSASVSDEQKFGSLRMISGRRSTRPLAPLTFQHSIRDSPTFRRLPNDFNDTSASLNVTVGSEIPNESFSTPIVAVKGQARKRTAADSEELIDTSENDKSPKKARLDFSGLLGVLASPVTMLRAKFSRAQIQSSTPNEKLIADPNDSINSECNDNLNVSGIESEEAMQEDVEYVPNEEGPSVDDDLMKNEKLTLLSTENCEEPNDDNEPPIDVKEIKKSRCNIM